MVCILTKAGALSIRSDSRGNNHHYSEGVSHLLTPIKPEAKRIPHMIGDRLSPKTLLWGIPHGILKGRFINILEKPRKTAFHTT